MINELIKTSTEHGLSTIGIVVIACSGIVQFSKININPWSAIGKVCLIPLKKIRDIMLAPIIEEFSMINEKITSLTEEIETLKKEQTEIKEQDRKKTKAVLRRHILTFGDELRIGIRHSKEAFDNTLNDISEYARLVDLTHDPNHVLTNALDVIDSAYEKCLRDNDFL